MYILNIKGKRAYKYRGKIKEFGFKYSSSTHQWELKTSDGKQIRKIKRYCNWHKLKLTEKNSEYARSSNYRKDFFSSISPAFHGKYFCAYCGKLLEPGDVVVDHIIPVHAVQTSRKLQKKLERKGWETENDVRNLCASCSRCNSKKKDKTGLWVLRGRLGRHNAFQWIRKGLRIAVLCGMIYFVWWLVKDGAANGVNVVRWCKEGLFLK